MFKKIFITVSIIALLTIIGSIGYIYYTYIAPEDRPDFVNTALNYFPFGEPSTSTVPAPTPIDTGGQTTIIEQPNLPVIIPVLRKITATPIAGIGPITRTIDIVEEDGTRSKKIITGVRYVERGTGHIYEAATDSNQITKLTSNTIPKISEAAFGAQAGSVLVRYANSLDTINTYAGRLIVSNTSTASTTNTFTFDGSFLPLNITSVAVSPAKDRIAYIEHTDTGSQLVTSGFTGVGSVVMNSPIREWLIEWTQPTSVLLTTKPSAQVPGYVYRVAIPSGTRSVVLEPIPGITVLGDTTGTYIAYTRGGGNIDTHVLNTKTGSDTSLGVKTFVAEKCAWSKKVPTRVFCAVPNYIPTTNYPDAWYQGRVSFSDKIIQIDVSTGSVTPLAYPETDLNEPVDGLYLTLDQDEKNLFFINKKDSSLWQLRLAQPTP